jgi:anaerobic glycerol-3-phosphate dehydrogenase
MIEGNMTPIKDIGIVQTKDRVTWWNNTFSMVDAYKFQFATVRAPPGFKHMQHQC